MSFEKWCKENDHDIFSIGLEEAYKAGAQSQQAEIDELKKELETLQGMHNAVSLTAGDLLDERDELQKRIDEALKEIYSEKSKVECDVYQSVDADLIIGIGYDLHLILKGQNND